MSEEVVKEKKIPTKEQIIKFYKDQAEINAVKLANQKLTTEIAELHTREVEAYAKVAMLTHGDPNGGELPERPSGPPKPDKESQQSNKAEE